jgi:hypothetical protein
MIATLGSARAGESTELRRNGVTATPTKARRSTTALSLRLGMAFACLPVALFATALQLGLARNDATVRTVAYDATRGISVAQDIKLNLAELDAIVVEDLLDDSDLGPSGYPADYDDKRAELDDNLVLAASKAPVGEAYRQPLANINYALAHYHTLVKEAFIAGSSGNPALAAARYADAHRVMKGTLLSSADFVDKANTYVLNHAYDTQKARQASTGRFIVLSWIALLAFLVVVQLLLARKFRRLLNVPLLAATVVTLLSGAFVLSRLDAAADHLSQAREQAFDEVHVLARAGATIVAARQAQGQLLLDPTAPANASATDKAFGEEVDKLFRVQGQADVTELAQAGKVPAGSGGYLAKVTLADREDQEDHDIRDALVSFGHFLAENAGIHRSIDDGAVDAAVVQYRNGGAFKQLMNTIDEALAVDSATFDRHARLATESTAHVHSIAALSAASVLLLILLGLFLRLREYGT